MNNKTAPTPPTDAEIDQMITAAQRFIRWRAENKFENEPNAESNIVDMLKAVHVGNPGMKFDWAKLNSFGDSDFLHDISGIIRHVNTPSDRGPTGFLRRCFLPRSAR